MINKTIAFFSNSVENMFFFGHNGSLSYRLVRILHSKVTHYRGFHKNSNKIFRKNNRKFHLISFDQILHRTTTNCILLMFLTTKYSQQIWTFLFETFIFWAQRRKKLIQIQKLFRWTMLVDWYSTGLGRLLLYWTQNIPQRLCHIPFLFVHMTQENTRRI